MNRDTRTDLDARIAAAWPITVDETTGRSPSELRAEIDHRIGSGHRSAFERRPRGARGPGAPARPSSRRWATALVAAVLVLGALVVGGTIAQRPDPADPGVVSPIDDGPGDASGLVDDPRAVLDAAVAPTREAMDDAGLRWSTELWRTRGPVDVSNITRRQLGTPHVARYRAADRDGDWSQQPVRDAGSPPLAMRVVGDRQFVRTGDAGSWTEITDLDPFGTDADHGLLDRDRLMDVVAAVPFVLSAPSDDGLIHLVTAPLENAGPLAVALGTLPDAGNTVGGPRAVRADILIDSGSGTIRQVTLWQRPAVDAGQPDRELDIVRRTTVTLLHGADVPDIVVPEATRATTMLDFCAAAGHDPGRCQAATFVRPMLDPMDDVAPVDP